MASAKIQWAISRILQASEAGMQFEIHPEAIGCRIGLSVPSDDSLQASEAVRRLSSALERAACSLGADDSRHSSEALSAMSEVAGDAHRIFNELEEMVNAARNRPERRAQMSSLDACRQSSSQTRRTAYLLCLTECLHLTALLICQVLQLGKLMASRKRSHNSKTRAVITKHIEEERTKVQSTLILRCSQFRVANQLYEPSCKEYTLNRATSTEPLGNDQADAGGDVEFTVEEPQPQYLRDMMDSPDEITERSQDAINLLLNHWTCCNTVHDQVSGVQEQSVALTEKDRFGCRMPSDDSSARSRRRKVSPRYTDVLEFGKSGPSSEECAGLVKHEHPEHSLIRESKPSIFSGLFSPESVQLDVDTYMHNAEYQLRRQPSTLSSQRYQPRDQVCDANVCNALSLIARHFQRVDAVIAELIQSLVPIFPREIVVHLLSGARNSATTARKAAAIEMTYLGDLGHFCEALVDDGDGDDGGVERASIVFQVRRVNNQWLDYLQDALELPYWEIAVDMLATVAFNMTSSHSAMLAIYHITEGRKRAVEAQFELLQAQYSEGRVSEKPPFNIMEGIRTRLAVLERIENLLCPAENLLHLQMFPKGNHSSLQPTAGATCCRNSLERPITISIIFITLALALLPGMVAFGKAAASGEIGSADDSDFFVTIRDSIMAVLAVALAVAPMVRRAHQRTRAILSTMIFSVLSIALAVISVAIYPKVHTGYSSLSGFFAQFFAIVSLTMQSMESAGSVREDGCTCMDHGKRPKEVSKVKSQ